MGLIGGRHNDILPRAQPEALSHLPQINVGLAASLGSVHHEEFLLHVLLVTMHLTDTQSSTIIRYKISQDSECEQLFQVKLVREEEHAHSNVHNAHYSASTGERALRGLSIIFPYLLWHLRTNGERKTLDETLFHKYVSAF